MTEEYAHPADAEPENMCRARLTRCIYMGAVFSERSAHCAATSKAIDFLNQSRKFWLKTNCRQTQGQLAIAPARVRTFTSAKDSTPNPSWNSIKERSVTNEEMGMFGAKRS
jgi:hypothetical protein